MARLSIGLMAAAAALGLSILLLWPGGGNDLPDFSDWPAGQERKERFFAYLRPMLEAENQRVLAQRRRLLRIAAEADPGPLDRRWLQGLAREYALDPDALETDALIAKLTVRVDQVPVSLGLAQAAKESAWGTSRFARTGNALFGQRCFVAGCGIVPTARIAGARHEVRDFSSPRAAVSSYVHNLNTHPDYQAFRKLRARLRTEGKRVTGFVLARTLGQYSERRHDYVQEIREMIRFNQLGPVSSDG